MSTVSKTPHWQLWIDTGGTFTDCVALDPQGNIHRLKVLSHSVLRGKVDSVISPTEFKARIHWPVPSEVLNNFTLRLVGKSEKTTVRSVHIESGKVVLSGDVGLRAGQTFEITSGEEVPVLAARLLTSTPLHKSFPAMEVRLGSTRGTNAILERKGARTALLVTEGFRDLLLIGNQQRPDLFSLQVNRPLPLYDCVFEVRGRINAAGTVEQGLDVAILKNIGDQLRRKKIDSVAVALLNSYKNPVHELEVREWLRQQGLRYVSASHLLSPSIRLLSRAETAVANAYLDPIIDKYLDGITTKLAGSQLSVMTSAGSLVKTSAFNPKDSVLSGPAGGVVGAAVKAGKSGKMRLISFDMGGTSTDVSLYRGRYDYRFESVVGSCRILSPSIAIETIAAGGGSICEFDGYRLTVGPASAGASPGPACYGAGGPLTITDVNLLLGRMDPAQFAIPVDAAKSEQALTVVLKRIQKSTGKKVTPTSVLLSFVQIANEKMAEAIRKISVQEGHDPKMFTLLSFGGAGGQHACALADLLGMSEILVPYEAGLLSAYGIGHAVQEKFRELQVLQPLEKFETTKASVIDSLFGSAVRLFQSEGHPPNEVIRARTLIFMRFKGQDSTLEIEFSDGDNLRQKFEKHYREVFGHWVELPIEVESVRVIASLANRRSVAPAPRARVYTPRPSRKGRMWLEAGNQSASLYRWEDLQVGAVVKGPALISSDNSTTVVEAGWTWSLDSNQNAIMTRDAQRKKVAQKHSTIAELELFTNRFTALAQEMGAMLQRTAFSVNVKERLDFSCALLDANGYLVVNAPHIPVHLGSLGVCVREVARQIKMEPGDVIITNHPAFGGSHLPDVTLIKPVHLGRKLVGYVANRAHHAEIGGMEPGSMPAHATRLTEEGVIIEPTYLVRRGVPQWAEIRRRLLTAPWPSRLVDENLADLNAALASVQFGETALIDLCNHFGAATVRRQMLALRKYAAMLFRERLKELPAIELRATELLDDGSKLKVTLARKGNVLKIDFTGSSKVHPGNLNATPAIVQSVVLYCLRLLVGKPIPMNEGLMDSVRLILPQGMLNPGFKQKELPAVVGGNTEVSQRLTDTVLKALGLVACSQGTMNNLLFGNKSFGYYETIAGGTGAGPGFDGADGVHHHMTNTRITDAEVIEHRYPVQLVRFGLRKGSGGDGKWKGGDGVERMLKFTEALEVNILSQHRVIPPYGQKGGAAGSTGEQFIIRESGKRQKLKGMDSVHVNPGDMLVMRTPGGGGWGKC